MVIVICYGKEEKWESRKEAIKYYKEGIACCEGSERDRYCNIYYDLVSGKDICTDDDSELF